MTSERTGRVRIVRPAKYPDRLRKYTIITNGKQAGKIPAGGTLELELPCGEAIFEARIDWCKSEPLKVMVVPGGVAEIEVANNWGALLGLWAISIGSDSYLILRSR